MDPPSSIRLGVSHISFLSISPRTRPQLLRKKGGAPFGRESLESVMGLTRGGREGRREGARHTIPEQRPGPGDPHLREGRFSSNEVEGGSDARTTKWGSGGQREAGEWGDRGWSAPRVKKLP